MGNLYKDKLSGSRIGIVFGAFAPCHIGHLEVILKAKKENDGCVVIVCGEDGDCGEPFGLDVYRRFRYMRELFADWEIVSLHEHEDTIEEGTAHVGRSALIDLVARKPTGR